MHPEICQASAARMDSGALALLVVLHLHTQVYKEGERREKQRMSTNFRFVSRFSLSFFFLFFIQRENFISMQLMDTLIGVVIHLESPSLIISPTLLHSLTSPPHRLFDAGH